HASGQPDRPINSLQMHIVIESFRSVGISRLPSVNINLYPVFPGFVMTAHQEYRDKQRRQGGHNHPEAPDVLSSHRVRHLPHRYTGSLSPQPSSIGIGFQGLVSIPRTLVTSDDLISSCTFRASSGERTVGAYRSRSVMPSPVNSLKL